MTSLHHDKAVLVRGLMEHSCPQLYDQSGRQLRHYHSSTGLQGTVRPTVEHDPSPSWTRLSAEVRADQHSAIARQRRDDEMQLDRARHTSHRQPTAVRRITDGTICDEKRARNLLNTSSRLHVQDSPFSSDSTLLHPQMSPYDSHRRWSTYSTYSAPENLGHYQNMITSRVNDLDHLSPYSDGDDYVQSNIPRAPTYPPSSRSRINRNPRLNDAAFANEHEFRLFVEATAGLGPEQLMRNETTVTSVYTSPRRMRSERIPQTAFDSTDSREIISPSSETLTTRLALAQLSQLPQGSFGHYHGPINQSRVETWLLPQSETPHLRDIEPWDYVDDAAPDDELPDYAESQAQAQLQQRAEAARRAQELQRRWQSSGARRGI